MSITCVLIQTSYDLINITNILTKDARENLIAQIFQNGSVGMHVQDDNIDVRIESNFISITLNNATCENEGVFRFNVKLGNDVAIAQTSLRISSRY